MAMVAQAEPVIVRARPTDIAFAAQLHREALPDSFFSSLGDGFLRSYYRMFLRSDHAALLIGTIDGRPAGMLAGTVDDLAHVRWATRSYWWRLALAGAFALVRRPTVLWRFARTRYRRYARGILRLRRATVTADPAEPALGAPGQAGTLTHIAIEEAVRGSGLGRALAGAFQLEAARRGAERVTASTRRGGAGASGFYAQLGWKKVGQARDLDGREFDRWRLDI